MGEESEVLDGFLISHDTEKILCMHSELKFFYRFLGFPPGVEPTYTSQNDSRRYRWVEEGTIQGRRTTVTGGKDRMRNQIST